MSNIIQFISLEINDKNLIEAWKKMSAQITNDLQGAPGFISRDSAIDEAGSVYCILKWESQEHIDAMEKTMNTPEFQEKMKAFGEIVNMESMKSKTLKVF